MARGISFGLVAAPGHLMVVCGTDGAGKSTLISRIESAMKDQGRALLITKSPTDFIREFAPYASYKRAIDRQSYSYRSIAMCVMADRIAHVEQTILPALRTGATVICDRYVYAGLARLKMHGDETDAWFWAATQHLVAPTRTYLLWASEETIAKRLRARRAEANSETEILEALHFQRLLLAMADTMSFRLFSSDENSEATLAKLVLLDWEASAYK